MWLVQQRRRLAIIGGGAALCLAAGVAILIVLNGGPDLPDAATAPPLTSGRAEQLGADVISGDAARVQQALALPEGVTLDPAAVGALAKLKITLDPASFHPVDAQTATLTGTVSDVGGSARPVRFTLVLADGQWRLVSAGDLT